MLVIGLAVIVGIISILLASRDRQADAELDEEMARIRREIAERDQPR